VYVLLILKLLKSYYPTFHAAPVEYTGTGTAPPPVTATPKDGLKASVTNALAPTPLVDAEGRVATV
jgi:hypothetical protein